MPKDSAADELSMSNTKKEMLDAYNSLLKKLEEKRSVDMKPQEKAQIKEKETVIQKADSLSSEKIMKDISNLKFEFGNVLTGLSDKLDEEISKYSSLKKAVEIKENELREFYEIQKAASSLTALIEAQRIKKSDFEDEIEEKQAELEEEISGKRSDWEKEKKIHEAEIKERNEKEQKQRARLEEEFEYNFKMKKKQFEDDFSIKKANLERELANLKEETEKSLSGREKALADAENELKALREKAAAYSEELQKAVDSAVKAATEKIILESGHNENMLKAKFEGEKQVLLTKIESYEGIIKEQNQRIEKLSSQIEKSYGQVQNIALKAVEGSSASGMQNAGRRTAETLAKNDE